MRHIFAIFAVVLSAFMCSPASIGQVYQTYGTHNPADASPCQEPSCVYPRAKGDPADPVWPVFWQADWTMYRVFSGYRQVPPPYPGRPPAPLRDGADYQTSSGATFYDSTWRGAAGEGAMMERYDGYCLPIFPIDNHFSCKFISLGNVAYFVAGDTRPKWMPRICLFSPLNHPPRPDFITHLPYSAADSARIGKGGQGYSFWISAADGHVMQAGASPDRTADGGILFGYGFQADAAGAVLPQSFYFSGYPLAPANAPIVSQNYTHFAPTQPGPDLWSEVAGLDPATLPACQLFNPPKPSQAAALSVSPPTARAPTWSDIGHWKP